jgi:hypothetical protein
MWVVVNDERRTAETQGPRVSTHLPWFAAGGSFFGRRVDYVVPSSTAHHVVVVILGFSPHALLTSSTCPSPRLMVQVAGRRANGHKPLVAEGFESTEHVLSAQPCRRTTGVETVCSSSVFRLRPRHQRHFQCRERGGQGCLAMGVHEWRASGLPQRSGPCLGGRTEHLVGLGHPP